MRYWWVNQKQTHRHEIGGGYLWSPKRRSDGTRHQFYENMKAVAPGDVVFCYWEGAVRAHGSLRSFGYDAPKPVEFGEAGRNWSEIGYRADVAYLLLDAPVRPRDEWLAIQPLLPAKYSPLHGESGKGLQSVYLAALPEALGQLLSELVFRGVTRSEFLMHARCSLRHWSWSSASGGSSTKFARSYRSRSMKPSERQSSARGAARVASGRT